MVKLDLNLLYHQLKDKYALVLTNALSLNAGFRTDCQVLFGKSSQNIFYLYNDGNLAIFEIENQEGTLCDHWHPSDIQEATQMIIDFMEDTCEFDWWPIG